jgi:hypothetical protein
MSSATVAWSDEREDARSDAPIECAFCGRTATAMHAIPSFARPESVVLVCDRHDAGGDRAPLARPPVPVPPGAGAPGLERLARAFTLAGRALLALAVLLALIYAIAQL